MKNIFIAAMLFTLPAGLANAQDDEKKSAKQAADMQAMMAAYERAAAPGAEHKALQKMVGRWSATVKHWSGPGEPMVEAGSAETKAILGDRFVQTTFSSTFMGRPFTGIGITGYDNVKKKYVSTWLDSMATGIMRIEGTMDPGGRVLTQKATHTNPMTGKETSTRIVTTLNGETSYTDEFYEKRGGRDVKTMEITYIKVK